MNMSEPEIWEHGSEFHLLDGQAAEQFSGPWDKGGVMFGSGRDALRALLEHGRAARGWKRLWVPAYLCQEVVSAALLTGIEVQAYADNPTESGSGFEAVSGRWGDALLRVNYFGLRHLGEAEELRRQGVEVIDDHTHDPWSESAFSDVADWGVASLRKALPIPDGGVIWSPRGYTPPAPAAVTTEHRTASLEKFAAMTLKKLYLAGHHIDKSVFRELALSGEARLAQGPVSGMPAWTAALMTSFPALEWRSRRRDNHAALAGALAGGNGASVLLPKDSRTCPFSAAILFDTAQRCTRVRQKLIAANVYPAVLWPLESPPIPNIRDSDVDLSRRLLSLHCDMRYESADMDRVADVVRMSLK
jgi:hypothetical protein